MYMFSTQKIPTRKKMLFLADGGLPPPPLKKTSAEFFLRAYLDGPKPSKRYFRSLKTLFCFLELFSCTQKLRNFQELIMPFAGI